MLDYRIETDSIGSLKISNKHYYGIQTKRAIENFRISGIPIYKFPELIKALGLVKYACAEANNLAGKMSDEKAEYIKQAAMDVANLKYLHEFKIDVMQGGAGTSTNMNANEVIANVALEKKNLPKGSYTSIHPLDDVNMSQSTNDVYPTAIRLALVQETKKMFGNMDKLVETLDWLAEKHKNHIKMGRTQLEDAVPMTSGQEFKAFAIRFEDSKKGIESTFADLLTINMGGTAIGTSVTAPIKYLQSIVPCLKEITGLPVVQSPHLIEATTKVSSFVHLSSMLRILAVNLNKMANDLRLLNSGPHTGMEDIQLPPVQAGSTLMPGKVNPVIAESVNLVCFYVFGMDLSVLFAANGSQLQLNAFEPLIFYQLMTGISLLKHALHTVRIKALEKLKVNVASNYARAMNNQGIVTFFNQKLGYDKAAQLVKESLKTGKSVITLINEQHLLSPEEIDEVLHWENLTDPAHVKKQ